MFYTAFTRWNIDRFRRLDASRQDALRWFVVAAQAASILITWPLWQVRQSPPNLPLIGWPQFDIGWLLLASLLLVLAKPIAGTVTHSVLLLLALSMDQMRIQPEFISLAFLLWGTLPLLAARTLCRFHLISLWFYAGLHKLLSAGYVTGSGRATWQNLIPGVSDQFASALAVIVALLEVGLAVMILVPRLRIAAAWLACGLHLGILIQLMSRDWNVAVWPWNAALAFCGFALFRKWPEAAWKSWRGSTVIVRVVAVLLLVTPVGYYVGLVDAYMAHCLYSSNTPKAMFFVATVSEATDSDSLVGFRLGLKRVDLSAASLKSLRVPFPPAHRLYDAYFDRVAQPGDSLTVYDPRKWAAATGRNERKLTRDGDRVFWHSQKVKAAEGSFVAGRQHGFWSFWFATGMIWAEGKYNHGRRVGTWTFWDAQGNLQAVETCCGPSRNTRE